MTGLRQRRGVLAVDRVDRLEEPKEHVHIHRVVRQGVLQGTLSFVGMLLPLLAFRALLLPQHFWAALPMSARCAAGPLGALVWRAVRALRCIMSLSFAPQRAALICCVVPSAGQARAVGSGQRTVVPVFATSGDGRTGDDARDFTRARLRASSVSRLVHLQNT